MSNVYEVKVTKVVTSEDKDIIEVNEDLDPNSEETLNGLKSIYEDRHYGWMNNSRDRNETNLELSFELVESDEEPSHYLTNHKKTDNLVKREEKRIEGNEGIDKGSYSYEGLSLLAPFYTRNFCPDETKSVFRYENRKIRSNSPIPSSYLNFYFDIDKETVSKLWESGEIEELMKHNIIPKESRMKNRGGGTLDCHPNDSKVIKEIYKRRKSSLGVSKMDLYDVDVWKNEDTYEKDESGYKKLVGISLLD